MNVQIGEVIRQLRINSNFTQSELGKAIGVSTQAISKWERGGTPDIAMLPIIADFFNISIDELFSRKNSSKNDPLHEVYYDLLKTNHNEKFEKASEYCWNIIKGVSDINGLEEYKYSNANPDDDCTRCRVVYEDGIAFMPSTSTFHMACIAPEPKDGYNSILGSISDYSRLFSMLSDCDYLKLLMFLYTRTDSLFSSEYASEKTDIPINKVKTILTDFEKENWILKECVDMGKNDSERTFFKPLNKEIFIFFMYFAKEMLFDQRLWHLSNCDRTTPFLRDMIN